MVFGAVWELGGMRASGELLELFSGLPKPRNPPRPALILDATAWRFALNGTP